VYTNKRSWSPQSSVSPATFPSVTLVEESGSHNWTAAQKIQEKEEIQGVGGLKRCNPLSEKPILSPKYCEYRRFVDL